MLTRFHNVPIAHLEMLLKSRSLDPQMHSVILRELSHRRKVEAALLEQQNQQRIAQEAQQKAAEEAKKAQQLKELNERKLTVNNLISEISPKMEKLRYLVNTLCDRKDSVTATIELAERFKEKITEKTIFLKKLKEQNIQLRKVKNKLSNASSIIDPPCELSENSIADLTTEFDFSATNSKLTDNNNLYITIEQDIKTIGELFAKADCVSSNLDPSISKLKQHLSDLQTASSDLENSIDGANQFVSNVNSVINNKQPKINTLKEQIRNIKHSNRNFSKDIHELNSRNYRHEEKNRLFEKYGIATINQDNNAFDSIIKNYSNTLSELTNSETTNISFDAILQTCKNIVAAAIMGNSEAKEIIGMRVQLADADDTATLLFKKLLNVVPQDSDQYKNVQLQLAVLNYQANQIIDNFADRLSNIANLLKASQGSLFKDPDGLATVNATAESILTREIVNINDNELYPYQICLNEPNFLERLSSLKTISENKKKELYSTYRSKLVEQCKFMKVQGQNNHVNLEIDANKLNRLTKPLVLIDNNTKLEVGRFYKRNGILHFNGLGNNVSLNIKGQLTSDTYRFDSKDAQIDLSANFTQEKDINIVSHTKSLVLYGDVKSEGYIHIETNNELNLSTDLKMTSKDRVNIETNVLNSSSAIQSQNCHLKADQINLDKNAIIHTEEDLTVIASDFENKANLKVGANLVVESKNNTKINASSDIEAQSIFIKGKHIYTNQDSKLLGQTFAAQAEEIQNNAQLKFDNVLMLSDCYENFGDIKADSELNILSKNVLNQGEMSTNVLYLGLDHTLTNKGKITASNGVMVCDHVSHEGTIEFNSLLVSAKSFKTTENSHTDIHDVLNVVSYDNEFNGHTIAQNIILDSAKSSFAGSLSANKAFLNASDAIVLDGEMHGIGEKCEFTINSSKVDYGDDSVMNLKDGTLLTHAKIINEKGIKQTQKEIVQSKFYQSTSENTSNQLIIDAENVNLPGNYKLEGDGSNFAVNAEQVKINNLKCDGEGLIEAKQIQVPGMIDAKKMGIISDKISLNNLAGDDVSINAKTINLDGDIHTKNALTLIGENEVTVGNSANIDTDKLISECKNKFTNNGAIKAKVASIKASQIGMNGTFKAESCYQEGQSVSLNGNTVVEDALLKAQKVELSGNIEQTKYDKCLQIESTNTNIKGNAKVNCAAISSKEIEIDANIDVSCLLRTKSDRFRMSQQSSISGSGAFSLEAANAELAHVDVDHLNLKIDHLNALDAIKHNGMFVDVKAKDNLFLDSDQDLTLNQPLSIPYSVHIKAPNINILAPIHSDKSLSLQSLNDIQFNNNKVDANEFLILDANNNIVNQSGNIFGNTGLYAHSTKQIVNRAGVIQSPIYVQLVTDQGDIINEAVQHTIRGEYGDMQKYTPAQILGGSGTEQGCGALIKAGGKIINDASTIQSVGNNYLEGNNGVEALPLYNQYLSYYKKWDNWPFRNATTKEYSWQIQQPVICSASGKNQLVSTTGPVNVLSLNLFGRDGNYISANKGITCSGINFNKELFKKSSQFFNIVHDNSRERRSLNVQTDLVTLKDTYLVSLNDVKLLNALIVSPGKLRIKGKNVLISSPILNYSYDQRSRNFGLSLPTFDCLPGASLVHDVESIKTAKNSFARLANVWNTSVDSLNVMNDAMNAARNGSFIALFNPSVEISYNDSHLSISKQFVPNNVGVFAGDLYIEAEHQIQFDNGVKVQVVNNAILDGEELIQQGAKLQSKMNYDSKAITVSVSAMDKPNVGAKFSQSKSRQTTYANQLFQVGGCLETYLKKWDMTAAKTIVGKWVGKVGLLSITSPASTSESESLAASIDTGKNFSFAHAKEKQAKVVNPSSIVVTDPTPNDQPAHVEETQLKDAFINDQNYKTEKLSKVQTKEYSERDSVVVAFNPDDFKNKRGKAIPCVGFQYNDVPVKIPLINQEALNHFIDNLNHVKQVIAPTEEKENVNKIIEKKASDNSNKGDTYKSEGQFIQDTQKVIDQVDNVLEMPITLNNGNDQDKDTDNNNNRDDAIPLNQLKYCPIDNFDVNEFISNPTFFTRPKANSWESKPVKNWDEVMSRPESIEKPLNKNTYEKENVYHKLASAYLNLQSVKTSEKERDEYLLEKGHQGLGFMGIFTGAGEYNNVRGGHWKGANREWYRMGWGGNQYTKSKYIPIYKAKKYNKIGKLAFKADMFLSTMLFYNAYREGNYAKAAKAALDAGMAGIGTFGGLPGFAISTTYTALDTIGWDNIGEAIEKRNEIERENRRILGNNIWMTHTK